MPFGLFKYVQVLAHRSGVELEKFCLKLVCMCGNGRV